MKNSLNSLLSEDLDMSREREWSIVGRGVT